MGRSDFKNDLTGRRFGKVIATEYLRGSGRWMYLCDCGNTRATLAQNLVAGRTQSCGCRALSGELRRGTHKLSQSGIYAIWVAMRDRCANVHNKQYKNYGGRGITVCERWMQFENFFSDMGHRPDGLSLDRKENNLGYSPENCRWATAREQSLNKRGNRLIEFGSVRQSITAWAEATGLARKTIDSRLHRGWSVGDALTRPSRARSANKRIDGSITRFRDELALAAQMQRQGATS